MDGPSPADFGTRCDAERRVVAIRKAATLVRAIPGLGVALSQSGRPGLRVAGWPPPPCCTRASISPVVFHRAAHVLTDCALGSVPAPLGFDLELPLQVELFGRREIEIEPQDLLRIDIGDGRGLFVFAAALDDLDWAAAACDAEPTPRNADAVRVDLDRDRDLDVTLVSARFPLTDGRREAEVRQVVVSLAAAYAAEEVASSLARLGSVG